MTNINTKTYWDKRFDSGDWERKQGRSQTRSFALAQINHFNLPENFDGTLLDFGCGLGDAIPVYRSRYPYAQLIGVDLSESAIAQCRTRYGDIANFASGDHLAVPHVDVIVASNVMEHLDNDEDVARSLIARCKKLIVVVPYRERPLCEEHVRAYDQYSFAALHPRRVHIFECEGWTPYGWRDLWVGVYLKNLARPFLGRPWVRRNRQVLFEFEVSGMTPILGER